MYIYIYIYSCPSILVAEGVCKGIGRSEPDSGSPRGCTQAFQRPSEVPLTKPPREGGACLSKKVSKQNKEINEQPQMSVCVYINIYIYIYNYT